MDNENNGQTKLCIFDGAQTKLEDFYDSEGPTNK